MFGIKYLQYGRYNIKIELHVFCIHAQKIYKLFYWRDKKQCLQN